MAIQEITVDMGQLASGISNMTELVTLLRNQMKEVFNHMTELDAMWDGVANDAFNQQFQIDNEAMEQLCKTFDSIIEHYTTADKEYNNCEDAVHDIVAAISIQEVS